jgi:large subunit ribosomal protein L15
MLMENKMLKLNELKPAVGAKKVAKRIGRGTGSGNGCTAGKGNNGHKARSGSSNKFYFEGGQTPLTRRLPKRGFHSPFKVTYQIVNVSSLEKLDAKEITIEIMYENGLIHEADSPVKVLGNGELTKSLIVKAHAFSKSAKDKIDKAKGKTEVINRA